MSATASRRRTVTIVAAVAAAVVALTLVFLGPGSFRIWSSQRAQTRQLNAKIDALNQANDRLQARADELRDPEAIKELARRDYGMVPKGSKAFAILPSPEPDDRPAGAWPFVTLTSKGAPPTTVAPQH